jgi:HlyD family secretion protein
MKTSLIQPLLSAMAVALLLSACGKKEEPAAVPVASKAANVSEVMGIAMVEPLRGISQLAQSQPGTVSAVLASPGQHLDSGQVILVIAHAVEQAQLAQSGARLSTQNENISGAMAALSLTETQLDKAKYDYSRDQALFKGNAITQQNLDDSQARVTELEKQFRVQQAQVKQQVARAAEIRAESGYYQQLIEKTVLKAPSKGTLLSLEAKAGEYLDGRSPVGEFAPDGPIIALTEIDEMFASQVKVGQKAYIRPQGGSEELSKGTVVLASPYLRKKSLFSDNPSNLEDRRVREVRIQLDDPSKVLIGARVECIILTQ